MYIQLRPHDPFHFRSPYLAKPRFFRRGGSADYEPVLYRGAESLPDDEPVRFIKAELEKFCDQPERLVHTAGAIATNIGFLRISEWTFLPNRK